MRNKLLLVSFVVSLLVLTVSFTSADAEDPVSLSNYYVEGFVADTGRVPMEGVTVSVMDRNGTVFHGETNGSGFFSVGIATNSGLMISFTTFGYSMVTCPNTTFPPGSEYMSINLSGVKYNSATRTYTLTGTIEDMQCAIMKTSDGTVRGQVTFGTTPVKNATVTLVPVNGEGTYSSHTGDSGHYEIVCPTGTYTLTAGSQGFNQSDAFQVNVTGSPSTVNVTLVKSELKKHLGLDMAHVLMLVGAIVGILLAVAAWFIGRRMNGSNSLEIIDDSVPEEDDDVRRP
ncbi:MAG: carboxypeptidase-like regulatory domain-containing protein [Methanomassiliicoccaceae archaeon]|nr:carboxypeptidase-like regulatory domain-containing protein [Methanomassiliicoccaceae archaeon]